MKATYVCSVLLREGERRDGARGKAWDVVRGWNPGGERNKDENWWVGPSPVENAPCAIYFAGEMDGPERTAWRREFTKVLNIMQEGTGSVGGQVSGARHRKAQGNPERNRGGNGRNERSLSRRDTQEVGGEGNHRLHGDAAATRRRPRRRGVQGAAEGAPFYQRGPQAIRRQRLDGRPR